MNAALVWFRRDLRIADHAALCHALEAYERVFCAFVFDTAILDRLAGRAYRRVAFIHASLVELDTSLRDLGGGLLVVRGRPHEEIVRLAKRLDVRAVHANRDYEPAAIDRDAQVRRRLAEAGVAFESHKDQVIFEQSEILTQQGSPFAVFTPYQRVWRARVSEAELRSFSIAPHANRLARTADAGVPSLSALGLRATSIDTPSVTPGEGSAKRMFAAFKTRIDAYRDRRDYPAMKGPSYLSAHLRFGTISIRTLARFAHARAGDGATTWLSELIWREFYFMILAHHPRVVTLPFRSEYASIEWDNDEQRFDAWCAGRTGYPIVDAAMRQLNQTGYMHNRLRMIVASFLTKDLGIDWRWGERYFGEQLLDYDLSANNGGWQWAASTGCDAQPYFRIFNPVTQSERFDRAGKFIRRYVPELAPVPEPFIHAPWTLRPIDQAALACIIGRDYPLPIVDHAKARQRALARYGRSKATKA